MCMDLNGYMARLMSGDAPEPGGLSPYGLRYGGDTPLGVNSGAKGSGYFGALPAADGNVMTELSSSFEHDGKVIPHPLVVPTLSAEELQHLQGGGEPTDEIMKKAQAFALDRIGKGLSPFAEPTGFRWPVPR